MLIERYALRLHRPRCNVNSEKVGAFGLVSVDLSPVMPYLNAVVKGANYAPGMPAINFRHEGDMVSVQPRQIGVGACRDEAEARERLERIVAFINDIWERREEIEPSEEAAPPLSVLDILRRLPGGNCGKCGEPTCMAFAAKLLLAERTIGECAPLLEDESRREQAAALIEDLVARGFEGAEGWV